jgi:hypothetical protein
MDAGHVVTGVGGPGGGDSRVDAAGHRGEHAKWIHRVRGYAPVGSSGTRHCLHCRRALPADCAEIDD